MRKLLVLAALAALLLVAAPAQAANSNVVIHPLGSYVSPASATIPVVVVCNAASGSATVVFSAPAGRPYAIAGELQAVCDGTEHGYTVPITGGVFQLNKVYTVHAAMTDDTGTINREGNVWLR
jgi:hypothetical protein